MITRYSVCYLQMRARLWVASWPGVHLRRVHSICLEVSYIKYRLTASCVQERARCSLSQPTLSMPLLRACCYHATDIIKRLSEPLGLITESIRSSLTAKWARWCYRAHVTEQLCISSLWLGRVRWAGYCYECSNEKMILHSKTVAWYCGTHWVKFSHTTVCEIMLVNSQEFMSLVLLRGELV